MEALKNTALLYAELEKALRQCVATASRATISELYARTDIKRVAKNVQQIKDCIYTLQKHRCVVPFPIIDKEESKKRGGRIDYVWREGNKFVLGAPLAKKQPAAKRVRQPSPVVITKPAKQSINEIELVLDGVEIIAGVNPLTGRVRIVIESK